MTRFLSPFDILQAHNPVLSSIPYIQVDAFTDRLFSGNPAGVCLLSEWLPDSLLQSIATENNVSETAFVTGRDGFYKLRWFTPTVEVDLCGHATLATAHVLYEYHGCNVPAIRFQTRSGELMVSRNGQLLTLDFPSRPATPCPTPSDLVEGLGAKPLLVAESERDYLAVFESEEIVRRLKPDFALLARLDCLGIIATAPGNRANFVSRFFAPAAGIPEDPVTGSAHCTLIPYWCGRLNRTELQALQVSKRGGELFCKLVGDRVHIAGRAVTYSSGHLHIPSSGN